MTLINHFRCQVLYDYTPQNPDELEIHVGDIISIIEMCDDGWYCGIMEKSDHKPNMQFGTFPGNYVQLLPIERMVWYTVEWIHSDQQRALSIFCFYLFVDVDSNIFDVYF